MGQSTWGFQELIAVTTHPVIMKFMVPLSLLIVSMANGQEDIDAASLNAILPEGFDTITDGFQKFLEYLPEIKSNINAALDSIPGIKDEVQKQINNMPEKETIKEHVNSLISKLPEAEGVEMFKETVNRHIDSLPTKDAVNDYIDDYVGQIPDADYIHK